MSARVLRKRSKPAGRIAKIVQTVVDLAASLASAVSSVFSTIGKVAQRLLRIERAEVSEATVTAAARTPEVAETTEAAAVEHLETIGAQVQKVKDTVANPKDFDPNSLAGMNSKDLENAIPPVGPANPASPVAARVFRDPTNPGR